MTDEYSSIKAPVEGRRMVNSAKSSTTMRAITEAVLVRHVSTAASSRDTFKEEVGNLSHHRSHYPIPYSIEAIVRVNFRVQRYTRMILQTLFLLKFPFPRLMFLREIRGGRSTNAGRTIISISDPGPTRGTAQKYGGRSSSSDWG